jgi:hypothetical protein
MLCMAALLEQCHRRVLMDETLRKSLTNRASWGRGGVMLLFFLMLLVVTPVLMVLSLAGWLMLLLRGQVPTAISTFGVELADWYGQTVRYLTGSARRRPFPFEDLDCPADDPPQAAASDRAQAAGSGRTSTGAGSVMRSGGAENNLEEKPAGQPLADHRAGKKTATRKKANKKKAGKKTAAKKKSGKKKATAKTATTDAGGPDEKGADRVE